MSGVIPKEQLAAYQRWQANAFDEPATEAAPAPVDLPAEAPPVVDEAAGEPVSGPLTLPTADDIEQIHEQARQEGYLAGLEEGRQAAAAAMQAERELEIARLAALTVGFREALAAFDQVIAEQALDLALEVASLVIGSTLRTRRELLLPVIREAMQALPLHHGNISLHAHPDDVDSLREGLGELGTQGTIHLVADSALTPGGCILKSGNSEIDARLETRWQRVLEAIGVDPEQWLIR